MRRRRREEQEFEAARAVLHRQRLLLPGRARSERQRRPPRNARSVRGHRLPMNEVLPRAAALAALCSGVLLAGWANAAPCGRPDVDLTFPPNEAQNVPNNALF